MLEATAVRRVHSPANRMPSPKINFPPYMEARMPAGIWVTV